MVLLSMTLIDPWPGVQGRDIFGHWISQKRHDIEPYLLTSIVSHTWCIKWCHFQWPSLILNPVSRFIFRRYRNMVSILMVSKSCGQSYYRTVIGNYTQSIEWYHFQWPWLTSDLDFKFTTFLTSNMSTLLNCQRGYRPTGNSLLFTD